MGIKLNNSGEYIPTKMPYSMRRLTRRNCWQVKNTKSGRLFSKCSTKKKAKKQLRLLRAITYGNFRPTRPTTRRRRVRNR
jgi:hypothetical protein